MVAARPPPRAPRAPSLSLSPPPGRRRRPANCLQRSADFS